MPQVPACPTCRQPLTLGGDDFDPNIQAVTYGMCGLPAIGECLKCVIVYHASDKVWITHQEVSHRRIPSAPSGPPPYPRVCPECRANRHTTCFRAWVLEAASVKNKLRYVCACQYPDHSTTEIDWSDLVVRGDDRETPDD